MMGYKLDDTGLTAGTTQNSLLHHHLYIISPLLLKPESISGTKA
jgi:hypothetical protein